MMATRTLAVSSGLGALFLLHGCGDKKPVDTPPVADSPAPPGGPDASPLDGDVPAPPAVGGSWSDLVSFVNDQSLSKFKKQNVAEFADEYLAKKVTVDSSPDGKLFPAHAVQTTVSVILNDWNINEPCTESTKDDLQLAFMKKKKNDLEKLDLPSIKEFGQFHTVTQTRGSVYVADPAIIDDSDASKWTKAVFYKVLNDKTKVWVREDDEKKRKDVEPNKEAGDLRMNMVVVFTEKGDDKDTERRPYGNYNNFGMALVTPKDLSSPIDVFKSSMETFEILYTVMASAKKMQMGTPEDYEFIDNYKSYKTQKASDEAEDMNWWGAYADTDCDKKNSPVPTSKVGGKAPEFGRADRDDEEAVTQLEAITTAINKFFKVKKEIMQGTNMKYATPSGSDEPITSLEIPYGAYAGACQDRAAGLEKFSEQIKQFPGTKEEKAATTESLLDDFQAACYPVKAHEGSLFFRVKSVMETLKKDFGGAPQYVANNDQSKADAAKLNIKRNNIYDTYEKRQVLHQIMFAEFEEYAFKAHLVQNAVLDFYGAYMEDKNQNGPTLSVDKTATKINGHGAYIKVPHPEFQKHAEFTYPAKCQETNDNDQEYAKVPIEFQAPRRPAGQFMTWSMQKEDFPVTVAIWDPLFRALGELSQASDVSKMIPNTKQGWLSKKDEMKVRDEIVLEWKPFKFPSQMHLSTAEIKQIFIGVQSDKAEINAAIYAALVAQFYQKVENNEDKNNDFYLAVADPSKAKNDYVNTFKNGHSRMRGKVADDKAKRIPEIVLAGSAWSDAKAKADSLFSEKKAKKKQDGNIATDAF